jgi:hypothetical protein
MTRKRNHVAPLLIAAAAAALVLVCGGVAVVGLLAIKKGPTQAVPEATATQPVGPVLEGGNGNPIINEFLANPIAAEKKWIGKRVRVWNEVGSIDRDKDGWYVSFRHCDLTVYIAAGQEERFGRLKRGDKITVEATLDRYATNARGGTIPYLWGRDARLVD